MRTNRMLSIAALAAMTVTSCDKSAPAATKEKERQLQEAIATQQDLKSQLEAQKIEAERAALDAERQRIEDARADLDKRNQDQSSAEAENLRAREDALARKEAALDDRETSLGGREQLLDEREMDLAGREPIPALDPTPDQPDAGPVSDYNVFYDQLGNDGSWFQTPDYGYVYQPAVVVQDSSWRPYTRGRWACSNRGWTWVSDEPFGWACYHYGRWALVKGRGWVWVPGEEWAPSWVSWRSGDDCLGWAPLPPESMGSHHHGWGTSVDADLCIGPSWYIFCALRHFGGPLRSHCYPASDNRHWWDLCHNVTNITYQHNQFNIGGPSWRDLNRRLPRPIPFYELNLNRYEGGRPNGGFGPRVAGNQLSLFAPTVNASWNASLRPAKVGGNWSDVQVDRPAPLGQEIADRFREAQADRQRRAAEAVAKLGGQQALQEKRLEVLAQNRKDDQEKVQAVFQERRKEIEQRQATAAAELKERRQQMQDNPAMAQLREKQEENRKAAEQRQQDLREKQAQAKAEAEQRRQEAEKARQTEPGEVLATDRIKAEQKMREEQQAKRQEELRNQQARNPNPGDRNRVDSPQPSPGDNRGNPADPNSPTHQWQTQQGPGNANANNNANGNDNGRMQNPRNGRNPVDPNAPARQGEIQQGTGAGNGNVVGNGRGQNDAGMTRQQGQQEQEAARQQAAVQARAQQQQQDQLRMQQEKAQQAQENARQQQEQARAAAQERMQQQQQQQEQARAAAQERAQQMQEQARAQQQERQRQVEEARQAAQERMQQQQEQARAAAQERAREQEQARQAAQERAQQAQEQARQAAQQRAADEAARKAQDDQQKKK